MKTHSPISAALLTRRCFCAAGIGIAHSALASTHKSSVRVPIAVSEQVDLAFVGQVLTAVETYANVTFDLQPVPFARMVMMVNDGQAFGFGLSPTIERSKHLLFSRELFHGSVWALGRRGANLTGLKVQRGLVICKSRTADYGGELQKALFPDTQTQNVDGDLRSRLRLLSSKHCDVLLVTARNSSPQALLGRLAATGVDPTEFVLSKGALVEQSVHMAAAKAGSLALHLPSIDRAISLAAARIRQISNLADSATADRGGLG